MPEPWRFVRLKPSQLTISLAFPQREYEPPLSLLKETILEFGLLRTIIVRQCDTGEYLVLDGRRYLKAIYELQDEGHERLFRWLPCFCIHSDGPIMDLRLFLLLNNHAHLGAGEYERVLAAIEAAQAKPRIQQI